MAAPDSVMKKGTPCGYLVTPGMRKIFLDKNRPVPCNSLSFSFLRALQKNTGELRVNGGGDHAMDEMNTVLGHR